MQPRSFASLWIALLLCAPSVVWAEAAPPEGSKPLTEILRPIEARSDFAYFEEIELEEGKYKIEYFTKDGSKQKIEVDPLTGATPAPAGARYNSAILMSMSSRTVARPKRVQYAALPYRPTGASGTEVMLVTSRGRQRWIIPKGWPHSGRAP